MESNKLVQILCYCKDCKYWDNGQCYGEHVYSDGYSGVYMEEDDFCSRGKPYIE